MENNNNKVNVIGEVVTDFEYSFQSHGEKFYSFEVAAMRKSGCADSIPVIVSERLVDVSQSLIGKQIHVTGNFRSYNKYQENRTKLILNVFARECEVTDTVSDCNCIEMEGYICKEVRYRKTPLGREISDLLLAVNRPYDKSDCIPCVIWGRNASYISNFAVGTKIKVVGRIQSREYVKQLEDGSSETRVAYEVSASEVKVMEESTNEE